MREQLTTLLDAVRAAQGALKDGQNTSMTVELLRDILGSSKVSGAARVLSADLDRLATAGAPPAETPLRH